MIIAAVAGNLAAQSPVVAPPQKKPVILTGGTIHTGTGTVIENGAIAFTAGKITFVGKASDSRPESRDAEVIDVTGKHVYPGLILPNTSLGLVEISGVDVTVDNREIGDINPNVRAIAAYNTDSHVIPVIRSNGILLAQIVPTGTLLPGTASVVQLDAWNWEDAAYRMDNGIILGWPRRATASQGRGTGPAPEQTAQTGQNSYDRNVEQLEKIFTDAAAYAEIEKPANTNLRLEALKGLFNGTKTLFINAPDSKSVLASVTFAKRYGVKKIVISVANESTWEVKDFLKENNIPVIVANPLSLPLYEHSDVRMPFKLAAMFMKEGILTGLTYSSMAYGNLPFAAGQAAAYGLTKEEALQTVTLNNAKILGIDDVTGTLEPGKDANIVVSSGDLLDMKTSNVELAYINGRNISLDNKHKQLTRRFKEKYNNINSGI
ncbi:MAG: amidohydrolase family protein [Bacteroidales bacterium]|nr:amidohydrolase family protein [Bacteroidales bacterium]